MPLARYSLPLPLLRLLIGSLTALLLTLPALEWFAAPALDRSNGEPGRRVLSFEERLSAQKAIEEVFWRHRFWPKENPGPKPALEAVLPDEAIRERVTDYLKKSNALENLWGRPLTAAQLQAEIERMARSSHQPEVLRELFAALHDDPFLIAECLARPNLADRFIRNWYAFDDRWHGARHAEALEALTRHRASIVKPPAGAEYREYTLRVRPADSEAPDPIADGRDIALPPEEYEDLVRITRIEAGLDPADADPGQPAHAGEFREARFGPLQEDETAFFAKTVIAEHADSIRVGMLRWSKTPFETWWNQERSHLDVNLSPPEETAGVVTLDSPGCTGDTWSPPIAFGPSPPRKLHTAVWTGSEMLVWGGLDANSSFFNSGLRYNPATDFWAPMNTQNTPSSRYRHTAIWTGTLMVIWGGDVPGGTTTDTGGRYDPTTDSWSATNSVLPSPRTAHTAVWTGTEMIVWGGATGAGPSLLSTAFNTGYRYNPSTDTWVSTSTGPGVPERRRFHSAVWTGSEMIVWGGEDTLNLQTIQFSTGGRYVPGTDTWTPTGGGPNLPSARHGHLGVWTGSQMIIYGGTAPGGDPISGARYHPGSDTWSNLNTPLYSAVQPAAVWTGTEMIAWGGNSTSLPQPGPIDLGFRYNPSSDTYVPTNPSGAPAARYQHTAVWAGSEMIIWGGTGAVAFDTGGRYNPVSDTWIPTSHLPSPWPRFSHSAIWTGVEMIIWGGSATGPQPVTGGGYWPATDTWTPTNSTPGQVPAGRSSHSAVWTGTEAIFWGGVNSDLGRLNTGGRYNPTSDTWTPTGTGANLPVARNQHSAVWTGTEMIVWGGRDATAGGVNSGGRYNPATDSWQPTGGGANLPSKRYGHSAQWTGDRMVVWGGSGTFNSDLTGGRYDPASDSWSAVSTSGAPSSPESHTSVWTGSEMIVWGKLGPAGNTGGRYNPITDDWNSTSIGSGVPSARGAHVAVWVDGEMIIWGGSASSVTVNTGSRYDPATDTWSPTSTGANVPTPRTNASAVWTGTEMIVWGGFYQTPLGTGGRYCKPCAASYLYHRDRDSDQFGDPTTTQTTCNPIPIPGFVSTSGDCLDTNAAVYPGATQICDGLNDDCSDASWPTVPANEANADGDPARICQGDCDDADPTIYPGAAQLCDGKNNDCLDAGWPAMPANEVDADSDGHRLCAPDCADGNPAVWTVPPEVSGLNLIGEGPTAITWNSQGALAGPETIYDLVGGLLGSAVGSLDFSAASCLQLSGPNSYSDTRAAPAVDSGYWYLARGLNSCGIGTYGPGRDAAIPPCP